MDIILNEYCKLNHIDTVPYVSFNLFEKDPELLCAFSTRLGGVSKREFSSMNLGFNRGDSDENVVKNYRLICDSMGILPENLVFPDQVHETTIRTASKEDCGKGIFRERDYKGVDAQITNERGVALVVFGADCGPVFFYDKTKGVIATAHAGWRGTVQGIVKKTAERMVTDYGCSVSDIRVVIGPSIGADCYEVSEDVAEQFMALPFEKRAIETIVQPEEGVPGKYMLNLWEANRQYLLSAGIPNENIVISGLCTMCRQDLFFSHRATNGKRGSLAGFLMLR